MMQLYITISVAGLHGSSDFTEMDTFKPGLKAWKVWCYFTELSDKISSLAELSLLDSALFISKWSLARRLYAGKRLTAVRGDQWINAADWG